MSATVYACPHFDQNGRGWPSSIESQVASNKQDYHYVSDFNNLQEIVESDPCSRRGLGVQGNNACTVVPEWACSAWGAGWASAGMCWGAGSRPSAVQTLCRPSPASSASWLLFPALLTPRHVFVGSSWIPEDNNDKKNSGYQSFLNCHSFCRAQWVKKRGC